MVSNDNFGLLRRILGAFGLSQEAVNDVIDFIMGLIADRADKPHTLKLPYQLRNTFFSPAEHKFYLVLRGIIKDRAILFTKVRLADVFQVKEDDPSQYRIHLNKIDRKHVDFLICDSVNLQPLLGIELDDKSHQRPDRIERDRFIDQVFNVSHLPLLHIPVQRSYSIEEIDSQLTPYLQETKSADREVDQSVDRGKQLSNHASPTCPKCGNPMILRTAKTGTNVGHLFWGCSTYPACRSMLPHQESK